MFGLREHPQRRLLAGEIRAWPYSSLRAPGRVAHLAALSGEGGGEDDRAHVAALCHAFGVTPPDAGDTHFLGDMGDFRFKWERHTEYSSYTFYTDGASVDPFDAPIPGMVPREWLAATPGEILAGISLVIQSDEGRQRSIDDLAHVFPDRTVSGSGVMGGQASVWTDFRIQEDGFTRFLVTVADMNERRLGRLVHRLLEIGTYRMLSMLAYPLARDSLPGIASSERGLSGIISRLADVEEVDDERRLLRELSVLAAGTEAASAATNYRFSAAKAYYGLIRRRVEELDEGRIEGFQPLGQTLFRRLVPAMETCQSVDARQEALSRRIARASDLLRTRVNVTLEEQNQKLLVSMNRRAKLQLRLQKTVEGLSVVAISYYMLSMASYLAKSAKAAGAPVNPDIAVGISFPFVVGAVWLGVRRIRRAIAEE